MALFNRGEVYTIVTDLDTNFWVQKFAENHCVAHSVIDVLSAGDFIAVSFRSNEKRHSISKKLKNTFESNCNIQKSGYLTLVTKRKEP